MKFNAILTAIILSTVAWNTVKATTPSESSRSTLTQFNEDVTVCRRVIRRYCAIAQRMMRETEFDQKAQREGLELLSEAREQWSAIIGKYAVNSPVDFAGDPMFAARLQDISNAVDDMTTALNDGDARRSMRACGFGCGLFVIMHEENGLVYALDRLFHLRRDIRTCRSVMNTGGIDGIRPLMPELLRKRDAVLLAPPPFPPEHEKHADYKAALNELSRAMDRLAMAVAANDIMQVQDILANGLTLVNKPYGIAL